MYWHDIFVECQILIVVGLLCWCFLAAVMFANIFKYTFWKLFWNSADEPFADEMAKLSDWAIHSLLPTMLLLLAITLILKMIFNF